MAALSPCPSIMDVISRRRSVRRYKPDPVPRPVIEELLTAATWAPSAHNSQPWRFAVIEKPAARETLARAMGERLRRDLEADNAPEEFITKDVSRSYDRITSAPVLILLCLTIKDMDVYADTKRAHNEYVMAVQSVAAAGQNLLLVAHDAGLGACWMCAPLFCPDVAQHVLDLPDDWQPQALFTLGYPARAPDPKLRNPLGSSVLWR